jgi:hypothetical protein
MDRLEFTKVLAALIEDHTEKLDLEPNITVLEEERDVIAVSTNDGYDLFIEVKSS